jgi:hypothetical protein
MISENRNVFALKTRSCYTPLVSGVLLFLLFASGTQGQILMKGTDAKSSEKNHATDYTGCLLSAYAAGQMRPQILPPNKVVRQDQYAALQSIIGHLIQALNVNPQFYFYNDQESPNAFATPEAFDSNFPNGTVIFGARLITLEAQQTGFANYTVAAIMAHEFAHILQFKLGEDLPTKQKELEADYMAGWYIANVSGTALDVASSEALRTFYSKGDYGFNDPNHHGTPQERMRAVQAGLRDSRSSLKQAFSHAHDFVAGD